MGLHKVVDEVDIAGDYIERTIAEGVDAIIKESQGREKRLLDMKAANIKNKCRNCDAELETYTTFFCDRECRDDYDKYVHQQKIKGLPVD